MFCVREILAQVSRAVVWLLGRAGASLLGALLALCARVVRVRHSRQPLAAHHLLDHPHSHRHTDVANVANFINAAASRAQRPQAGFTAIGASTHARTHARPRRATRQLPRYRIRMACR
jgi:hypothetical protein